MKWLYNVLFWMGLSLYSIIAFFLLFMKAQSFQSVNIMPFHTIGLYLWSDDLRLQAFAFSNIVGNIILFFPLGVYMPLLLKNKRLLSYTLLICSISMIVEVLQFLFRVGATDIDDVLLNTLGGAMGLLCYHVLRTWLRDVERIKRAVALLAPIAFTCGVMFLLRYNA